MWYHAGGVHDPKLRVARPWARWLSFHLPLGSGQRGWVPSTATALAPPCHLQEACPFYLQGMLRIHSVVASSVPHLGDYGRLAFPTSISGPLEAFCSPCGSETSKTSLPF